MTTRGPSSDIHAQHRGVDGMAEPVVNAGLDQLVVLAECGLVAPLLAQVVGGPSNSTTNNGPRIMEAMDSAFGWWYPTGRT